MSGDLAIDLAGEQIVLLPERAVFWPRETALFVADVHIGKAATMRAASLAVPGGTTSGDLARLDTILDRVGARRLVVLGDLLHARAGRASQTLDAVASWRHKRPALEVVLVRGNHDRGAGDPPAAWDIECVDAPHMLAPFVLQHHPDASNEGYVLAGHVHPAVQLVGTGRQRVKLACFWFGKNVGVLPAFGGFTGAALVEPRIGDRVFVVADDEVIAVT